MRSWADGDEVSTVYEIDIRTDEGAASMRMHEWHTVRDGQLVSTVMTFDTVAPAALLMHQALATDAAWMDARDEFTSRGPTRH